MLKFLKRLNKKERTWHDLNAFEKKKWKNIYNEKVSELTKQYGSKLEMYNVARRIADKELKLSRWRKPHE